MQRQQFTTDTAMDLVIDDDADHECPDPNLADCEICAERAEADSFLLDAPWGGQ